ncbi:MAG TPA: hypothetical protein VFT18_05335 [Gaiellaceae bacterium]|nr:hypothetical protein [Gaiellaceae bacterium]
MTHVLVILLTGLIVGALGRLAVPGRDPMPLWLTILIGIVGSIAGGMVALALGFGAGGVFVLSVLAATLIVIGYRLLVQKRPVTGPGSRLT